METGGEERRNVFADADEGWIVFLGRGNWGRGLHSPDGSECRPCQPNGGAGMARNYAGVSRIHVDVVQGHAGVVQGHGDAVAGDLVENRIIPGFCVFREIMTSHGRVDC